MRQITMLCHAVQYDIRIGIRKRWYNYLLLLIPLTLLVLDMQRKFELYQTNLSFFNLLAGLFLGCKEYDKSMGSSFEIPLSYMSFLLFNALINGWYPRREMSKRGSLSMMRMGDEKIWWYSKCIWGIINAFQFVILITAAVFIVHIFVGTGQVGIDDTICYLADIPVKNQNNMCIIIYTLCSGFFTFSVLNQLQIFLQLILSPVVAMVVHIVIMVLSAFDFQIYYVGNYIMLLRSSVCRNDGISFGIITLICTAVWICCMLAGRFYMLKRDIL